MGEVNIPVILVFVDNHRQHLCHRVVQALDAAIPARVVRTGRNSAHAEELVDRVRELGEEVQVVAGQKAAGASSESNVAILEDVGGALCRKIGVGDGKHISSAAEAVSEQQDVGTPGRCNRQGTSLFTLTATPGPESSGRDAISQEDVCLEVLPRGIEAVAEPPP